MTVFFTIISGVMVYVLGQIVILFIIDPFKRQKDTVSKIADFLIFHANRYTNTGLSNNLERDQRLEETSLLARKLASELIVRTQAVPAYAFLARTSLTSSLLEIRAAYEGLFLLSNSLYEKDQGINNYKTAKSIAEKLGISTEFQPNDPDDVKKNGQ